MEIRTERPADRGAVRRVNELAFGGHGEADVVEALRDAVRYRQREIGRSAVTLSLVAVEGDQVVGHIMFSPVTIETSCGPFDAVGLAPMAVLPAHQKKGVGTAMVRAGIERLKDGENTAVVVLGHPAYYPRFGFANASKYKIMWDKTAPDESFMALELEPGALKGKGGVARYRPEFDGVSHAI